MTRRRWIADEVSGDQAFLLGNNAEHLARVLRARIGRQFDIATPDGVRLGKITAIQPDRVTFTLQQAVKTAIASRQIHLYLSVFKFDRMEWAIEKCTELGIASLRPIIALRTEKHLAVAADKRVERWRRIVHEASQQSRSAAIPEVLVPQKLSAIVASAPGGRILLAENESHIVLCDMIDKEEGELSLAVGPEGGWTEKELGSFLEHGWRSASLGNTILRAETAAIAAVAITRCGLR